MEDKKDKIYGSKLIDEVLTESAQHFSKGADFRHHSFEVEDLEYGARCYVVVDYENDVTTLNYDYWTEDSMGLTTIMPDEVDKDRSYKTTRLSSLLEKAIEAGDVEEATVLAESIYKGVMYAYSISCCDKDTAFAALRELKDICDNTVHKIPFEFYDEGDDYIERTGLVKLSGIVTKNKGIADAMFAGDLDLIKFFVEEFDVNVNRFEGTTKNKKTPMGIVAENDGYIPQEIVDYLVASGAKPTAQDLKKAVKLGNVELARLFISLGADVNRVIDDETCLDTCLRIAKTKSKGPGFIKTVAMTAGLLAVKVRELEKCPDVNAMLDLLIESGAKTAEEVKTSKIPVVRTVATLKKNVKVKLARKQATKKEVKTEDSAKTL